MSRRNGGRGIATVSAGTRELLGPAAALAGTTVVTSGLGFAYWWLAARLASMDQVGEASSVVASMTMLCSLCMFGFGTMLIAESGRSRDRIGGLVSSSLLVVGVFSGLVAAVYVLVVRNFESGLGHAVSSVPGGWGLVAGVAIGAPALVLDQALVGLRLSGVQLQRNSVFSVVKLLLMWAIAAAVEYTTAGTIVWAWVAGSVISLVTTATALARRGRKVWHRPDFRGLRALNSTTFDHNLLNLSQTAPRMAVPLVAASLLTRQENAAFYSAWMLVGFILMLPAHLSMVMFAVSVGDRRALAPKLRVGALTALGPGLIGTVLVAVLAAPLLSFFGSGYTIAAPALTILCAAYVGNVFKQFYIAVYRVSDRIRVAAVVGGITGVLELAGAYIGGELGGMTGLAWGFTIALTAGCVLFLPPVVSAAFADRSPAGTVRTVSPAPGGSDTRGSRE